MKASASIPASTYGSNNVPNQYVSTSDFALLVDKRELRKALRTVGKEIATEARKLIRGAHSGKQYGKHIASATGEAPATLSGTLASSIKVRQRKDAVTVTDNAYYALFLETGAKGGGRAKGGASGKSKRRGQSRLATTSRVVEPRPYLSQALQKVDVQTQLDRALQTIISSRGSR